MISPKRALTEAALRLISSVQLEILTPAPSRTTSRILSGPFGPNDPSEVRRQALLLRLVSIIEAYIDALFLEITGEKIPNPDDFMARMIAEIEESASRDWSARADYFERLHGFSVKAGSSWQEIDAAIDARNSIAHGLGKLTARLRRKPHMAQRLRSIEASLGGGRIHLTDKTVSVVAQACRNVVLQVDEGI